MAAFARAERDARGFRIRQNDTAPYFRKTLVDENGAAINLTGATIVFSMRRADDPSAALTVSRQAVAIVTAASGIAEYRWAAANTATAGHYDAEMEETTSGGLVRTHGPWPVIVLDDLG